MKKVYCIGELLIDLVSKDGEDYSKKPGGAPANVAVAISKLEGKAYFLGQVGRDNFGKYLEEVLISNSVNTKYLKRDGKTTIAIVSLDKSGERNFDFYRGGDGEYDVNIEELLIDNDTIVHFGSATAFLPGKLRNTYYKALEEAKNKKAIITFDPNYRDVLITDDIMKRYKDDCWNFMREAEFIKISDEEAMLLTETNSLELAVKSLIDSKLNTIAITLGKEGTMIIKDGKTTIVGSIKIHQKDSTGAGDAFVGAVLSQLSKIDNKNEVSFEKWEEIVGFANKVGAITCTSYGAITSIPTMEEVENYIFIG
ncbi:carbohydrate kinase family protein [Clostridium nigeriense]|uniref:carbohydrate kinase family protein n=1 Tax=Clostridium nigeriense TaxID=1805470 RepID=UPI003D33E9EF